AAEAARGEQRKAADPVAHDFVMRGNSLLFRGYSPTNLTEARQAFERALEIDPRSNEAKIGLAMALAAGVTNAAGSASQDLPRAEQLAREAVERDPNSADAHVAMGWVRQRQKNRLREAQTEFETALTLNPNHLGAIRSPGWTSANLGEPQACL